MSHHWKSGLLELYISTHGHRYLRYEGRDIVVYLRYEGRGIAVYQRYEGRDIV